MPRKGIINGNGYECDICGKLLKSHDVFRVRCYKTVGHTGEFRMLDSIGVCEECYKREFPQLCGRGLLRNKIKGKKVGVVLNNL